MKNIQLKAQHIFIDGEIVFYSGFVEYMRYWLQEQNGADIEIRINSEGGDPFTAFSIYNLLKDYSGKVTVYIEMACLSAATLIACAGDEVIINEISFFMIHEAMVYPDWMREDDFEAAKAYLTQTNDNMVKVYMAKTGANEDQVRAWMKKTTWFTPQEAVDAGFVDRIEAFENQLEAQPFVLAAKYKNVPNELKAQGSKPPTKSQSVMNEHLKKLLARWGWSSDKSETDVVLDLDALKAKADRTETLESDIIAQKAEIDRLKGELQAMKAPVVPTAEQTAAVDAILTKAAAEFKIKNGDQDALKAQFATNPEGLEKVVALMPTGAHKPSGVQKPAGRASHSNYNINPAVAKAFQN